MQKMSDKLRQSLLGSNRPMVVVKAKSPHGLVTNLNIEKGTVTVDHTAQDARRTVEITITDESIVPDLYDAYGPVNVYAHQLYVYRGVLWNSSQIDPALWTCQAPIPENLLVPDNQAYELIPMGVFRITSVSTEEDKEGNVVTTIKGSDISLVLSQNQWTGPVTVGRTPYTIPVEAISSFDITPEQTYVAQTIMEAIKILINNRWPVHPAFGPPEFDFSGVVDMPITDAVIMGSSYNGATSSGSPWQDITALATALGAELFVDARGKFVLRTVPDPNSLPPVWSFLDGDGGLLTKVTREINVDKTVNFVIATGEGVGVAVPLRAEAIDNDPTSPTYYQGPLGRIVGRESGRKQLYTIQQVQNAANTYLNWYVGADEQVSIEGVVNPALDVADIIKVRRKHLGIYDAATVFTDLKMDVYTGQLYSSIICSPVRLPKNATSLPAGTTIRLLNNFSSQDVVLSQSVSPGDTVLNVEPFRPNVTYRKNCIVVDPTLPSDGSVSYFVDKLVIPLDLDSPLQITARARRHGSKKDAIRQAAYDQGQVN